MDVTAASSHGLECHAHEKSVMQGPLRYRAAHPGNLAVTAPFSWNVHQLSLIVCSHNSASFRSSETFLPPKGEITFTLTSDALRNMSPLYFPQRQTGSEFISPENGAGINSPSTPVLHGC